MQWRRSWLAALISLTSTGCLGVRVGSVATGGESLPYHRGAVVIRALSDPPGARELGAVEASGEETLEALVEAFVEQVRQLGGNVARIDAAAPAVEVRMRPMLQSVPCFGMRFQSGCSQTTMVPEELAVVRLVGRALRVEAP